MSAREKKLYAVILLLAVALASVSGYLLAFTQQSQRSPYSGFPEYGNSQSYLYPNSGSEQGAQLKTITVVGLGSASSKPNLVELRLGAITEATTATETLAKNSELMNRIIEALKAMGIREEEIETLYFNLYPKYVERVLVGFELTHMLRVRVTNLDNVGQIIDKAVEAGANTVEGVYFSITKEKLRELNGLARQKAVSDAKSKAEIIASSFGVKIVGVASVSEETGYYPSEYKVGIAEAFATPIMPPREVEVTITIRATFMIE
ncbi:MAG: SIMPL domain-containing protein [Candidatus Bathyarchaeia archaeon]